MLPRAGQMKATMEYVVLPDGSIFAIRNPEDLVEATALWLEEMADLTDSVTGKGKK